MNSVMPYFTLCFAGEKFAFSPVVKLRDDDKIMIQVLGANIVNESAQCVRVNLISILALDDGTRSGGPRHR